MKCHLVLFFRKFVALFLVLRLSAATPIVFDFDTGTPALQAQEPVSSTNLLFQTKAGFRAGFLTQQGAISIQSSNSFVHAGLPGIPASLGLTNLFAYASGLSNILEIRFDRLVTAISVNFVTPDTIGSSEVPTSVELTALTNSPSYPPVASTTAAGQYVGNTAIFPAGNLSLTSSVPFASARIFVAPGQTGGSTLFLVDNFTVVPSDDSRRLVSGSPSPIYAGTVSGGGLFAPGDTVPLTATANPGYVFISWTETNKVVTTQNALSVVAGTTNRWLVANFARLDTITATASPVAGGTVSGAGKFPEGSTATVTATAKPGYSFVSWTSKGTTLSTQPVYSFVISSNTPLVANFLPGNPVKLSVAPVNGGTVSGSGVYTNGALVAVVAHSYPNYSFIHWSDDTGVVSTDGIFTFRMNGARNLVATFAFTPSYTISTHVVPVGTGQTLGDGTYTGGDTVTVSAVPSSGYAFHDWSILSGFTPTIVSTNSVYSFAATASQTLQANFVKITVPPADAVIALTANAPGGTLIGAGTYPIGASITIAAQSFADWTFDHWAETNQVIGTATNYTFTATGNRVLQAVFAPIIQIGFDSNGILRASWPASASGFSLQNNVTLATNGWALATNVVGVGGGRSEIVIDNSGDPGFFRLVQP